MLTILCSWMFLEIGKSLQQCEKMLLDGCPLEHLYSSYSNVFRFKTSMEKSLGFIILLLNLSGFFTVFTSLSSILVEDNEQFVEREFLLTLLFHMIVRSTYLVIFFFSAANINGRDKSFRIAIFSYSLSRTNEKLDPIFLTSVNDSTSLSFTVCGFFELTRGFNASAIGILLTYSMLFLQLEKKDKQEDQKN
ncbi:hypothetical protein JTE90_027827 [Oedothorax gibbosus]|uniref:Uncharacterized protein n=1 Tax=Oedothorax gibbosus TaxID=931172 RepID=A0AAV6U568_9ARAC|nr:hypothetical protein JTE90_027827 [Oedothorax gibbosus]